MEGQISGRVRISDQVLSQNLGGEAVVLDLASENYFGLNEVGSRIWELLRAHGDLQAVLDALLLEYEVEGSRRREDLLALVDRLQEAGLVIIEGDSPSA